MSSDNDRMDVETDFQELLEGEDFPPEAFYLALKQALTQMESGGSGAYA